MHISDKETIRDAWRFRFGRSVVRRKSAKITRLDYRWETALIDGCVARVILQRSTHRADYYWGIIYLFIDDRLPLGDDIYIYICIYIITRLIIYGVNLTQYFIYKEWITVGYKFSGVIAVVTLTRYHHFSFAKIYIPF